MFRLIEWLFRFSLILYYRFSDSSFLLMILDGHKPPGFQKVTERSLNKVAAMSQSTGNLPKLDLKLHLSPPGSASVQSPSLSSKASPSSTPSSCVSSEHKQEDIIQFSNSPDAISMILVGCRRCMMYILLPEKDPKCPKCKSRDLIKEFRNSSTGSTSTATAAATTTTKKD